MVCLPRIKKVLLVDMLFFSGFNFLVHRIIREINYKNKQENFAIINQKKGKCRRMIRERNQ